MREVTVALERVKAGPTATTFREVPTEGKARTLRRHLKLDNAVLLAAGMASQSQAQGFQAPEKIKITVRA